MWKAKRVNIRLFRLFMPKSGLFRQKEDQFRNTFLKRPRSDKADLLGSTELFTYWALSVNDTTFLSSTAAPAITSAPHFSNNTLCRVPCSSPSPSCRRDRGCSMLIKSEADCSGRRLDQLSSTTYKKIVVSE